MANETTYALISSLLPDIWEAALMYAQQSFFMPSIVTSFMDEDGMEPRKNSAYATGTVVTGLGETTDLTTQAFSRAALSTLTPTEIGTQFIVTDRRMASDDMSVMADLAQHIGYTIFKQVETDLLSDGTLLTGGTVSMGAGTALTWAKIYQARAILEANAVPPPYNVVLHSYQWLSLATAANIAGLSNAAPLQIRDTIQTFYKVAQVNDMNFYSTGVLTAGTLVTGFMFNPMALAVDIRRGARTELERDASLRATEVNATMIYAHGGWKPTYGVQIKSDASTPS